MKTFRNEVIDECINKIIELERPQCSDHTPYRGACVSCGSIWNPDVLPDPDDVVEELEKLKQT